LELQGIVVPANADPTWAALICLNPSGARPVSSISRSNRPGHVAGRERLAGRERVKRCAQGLGKAGPGVIAEPMSDPSAPPGPPPGPPADRPPDRSGKPRPHTTAETRGAQAEREARLAAALRENLKRRKAQVRARQDTAGGPGKGSGEG
jgi:hypothetical protein